MFRQLFFNDYLAWDNINIDDNTNHHHHHYHNNNNINNNNNSKGETNELGPFNASLVFNRVVKRTIFVMKRIGVWRPWRHTSIQKSIEYPHPPPGHLIIAGNSTELNNEPRSLFKWVRVGTFRKNKTKKRSKANKTSNTPAFLLRFYQLVKTLSTDLSKRK